MIIIVVFAIWLIIVGTAMVVDARRGIVQRFVDLLKSNESEKKIKHIRVVGNRTHYVMTHEIGDDEGEIVTPTIRVPKFHGHGKHRHA